MLQFLKRKKRLLVLDDDSAMQRLVSTLLRREGYTVDVVSDGAEAVTLIGRRKYEALLLDVMTPTRGAATVLRHLRESRPEMLRRVVLVTASPASVVKSVGEDVFAVVRKPFAPDELTETVSRVVSQ